MEATWLPTSLRVDLGFSRPSGYVLYQRALADGSAYVVRDTISLATFVTIHLAASALPPTGDPSMYGVWRTIHRTPVYSMTARWISETDWTDVLTSSRWRDSTIGRWTE